MATIKKGQTVASPEYWKHLRWAKQAFWKRQRQDDRRIATASDDVPGKHRRRDRRKWCKGRVGIEHKPECRLYSDAIWARGYYVLVCTECGKHLDTYFEPQPYWLPPRMHRPKPDWFK